MSIDRDQVLADVVGKDEAGEDLMKDVQKIAGEMVMELLLSYLGKVPPPPTLTPNQALAMILSSLSDPKLVAFLQSIDEVGSVTDLARMVNMGYDYGFLHGWKAAKAA